jgi:hypothetical protein
MKPPGVKLPVISMLLMAIFLVGGSVALVLDWPQGPAHLDWGVWIVVYFGYVYVVAASVFYVLTGR